MNKIFIRSALLLLASGVLLIILFKNRSPFGKNNSSFASEPKRQITRVEFSQEGRRLYLEMQGDKWLINGELEARKSSILFIEKVLTEMKIKSPVSKDVFQKEIIEQGVVPVKVKVYEKRHLLKSFLVYKTKSNTYGNIMKIKEGSNPFIVSVPGYDINIGSGFIINDLYWQPYIVFNLLPSEIYSVNFENMVDSSSSFSIVNKDHHSTLSGIPGWDSTLVNRYLSYFVRVPFESWVFESGKEIENIPKEQNPSYRISVITTEGESTVLTLWEKMKGDNNTTDSDRLFGKTQNRDELFIIRYFDIDPLIKRRSYFYR